MRSPRCGARHDDCVQVEIARDWVDYVEAVGVLLSLVFAAGALVYAKKSSDSAAESAQGAEKTAVAAVQGAEQTRELVRIASDEHDLVLRELRRRPVLAPPSLTFQTT